MGVVNVNSTQITNSQATPVVLTSSYLSGGGDKIMTSVCTAGASDSAGSTYRFGRIPSGALVTNLAMMNDANTSGTSYKCGVYGINGGIVPVTGSDQIFFSAVSMASARNVWTNLYFPQILTAAGLVANTTLRVWELLGLATDSLVLYDVVITAVTAGSGGGNMAISMDYVV